MPSLQDKPFEDKSAIYATQNRYAASLHANAYQHQPQFKAFREGQDLPFTHYESFNKTEQLERRKLVLMLANCVWSPDRLKEAAS